MMMFKRHHPLILCEEDHKSSYQDDVAVVVQEELFSKAKTTNQKPASVEVLFCVCVRVVSVFFSILFSLQYLHPHSVSLSSNHKEKKKEMPRSHSLISSFENEKKEKSDLFRLFLSASHASASFLLFSFVQMM